MPESTAAVAQLLYLLDEAFEGSPWHALLGNLRSVTPADWDWVPPDGQRAIRDIVQHVASAKFMYHHYAFGDGQSAWTDLIETGEAPSAMPAVLAWLQAGHERLRQSIAGLDDAALLRPRPTHRGMLKETRWIIAVMIQHDLYHAGEINYIRALHQHDDL